MSNATVEFFTAKPPSRAKLAKVWVSQFTTQRAVQAAA
jgi:hypothetical protein